MPTFLWERTPQAPDLTEIERRVCVLESALRILAGASRLGDSYQRSEWLRMLEHDRAALRGYGVLA